MSPAQRVKPLSRRKRRFIFFSLLGLFLVVLPFLYLYAVGYRFTFGELTTLVPTGGLYIGADRTGAEIYINGELVRETRIFRRAFYAQGLAPGTHRVHVQRPGAHTWVKELPVYPHVVTEAQAFNLPLMPSVRVYSPWRNTQGDTILPREFAYEALIANSVVISASPAANARVADTEYATLVRLFADDAVGRTPPASPPAAEEPVLAATTTKTESGVRLFERDGGVFAEWTGSRGSMPYYYCAAAYELLGTATTTTSQTAGAHAAALELDEVELLGTLQQVPEDAPCEPVVALDRRGQEVSSFHFYPGSTDLVMLGLEDGVYVVEIDNRGWQNAQPLLLGTGLEVRVENGNVYLYDGELVMQVLPQ